MSNFLQNYQQLVKSIPHSAVSVQAEDSNYLDTTYYSSRCYFCFDNIFLENCLYCHNCDSSKEIVDCFMGGDNQLCYMCVNGIASYGCTYSVNCQNCRDCHFSFDLQGCNDCFGCVGLTRKQYCIYNKQYSKEEYFSHLEQLKNQHPGQIMEQMMAFKKSIPIPASLQMMAENCPYGDYIHHSKNSFWCFATYKVENSGYIYDSGNLTNCWDCFFVGGKKGTTGCYQLIDCGDCYNSGYLWISDNCTNCFYGQDLSGCSDCFGCVGLTRKQYCILNNQLTKEEYEKAIVDIKRELGWTK